MWIELRLGIKEGRLQSVGGNGSSFAVAFKFNTVISQGIVDSSLAFPFFMDIYFSRSEDIKFCPTVH